MRRLAWLAALLLPTAGAADSENETAVPYGPELGCGLCHTDQDDLTQLGDFGHDFLEADRRWGPALAANDADGDGLTNGVELQDPEGAWRPGQPAPGEPAALTHPGNPADPAPGACPPVPVGAPCADDPDCGGGAGTCFGGVVGGYCTVVGARACCPAGSYFLPELELCVRNCRRNDDCQPVPLVQREMSRNSDYLCPRPPRRRRLLASCRIRRSSAATGRG